MSTAFRVIVTKKADADELAIYHYISETFGTLYADRFSQKAYRSFYSYGKATFYWQARKTKYIHKGFNAK